MRSIMRLASTREQHCQRAVPLALSISLLLFAAGAAQAVPVSIWSNSVIPAVASVSDDNAVEVGLKFQSEIDGYVTAIRFYKGPANTGTHVGSLWSLSGVLLGTVTFSNETASGWQEQALTSPVAVQSNTTYVVSYHAPSGAYAADGGYFSTSAVTNYPLRALQSVLGEGNGTFRYGASSFPNQSVGGGNYWVDVVFDENATPDGSPPVVSGVTPADGSTNVVVSTLLEVVFSEAMAPGSIGTGTVELRDATNGLVGALVSYNSPLRTAYVAPDAYLDPGETYTMTVKGGEGGVSDIAGNTMDGDYAWSITTRSESLYGSGPGGPILLLTDESNAFSQYYAEILLAEGLNAFAVKDITSVSNGVLAGYDVAILGEMALSPDQVNTISNWVENGGNLLAMRPDKKLAGLLGLNDLASTLTNAYLLVDTVGGPGYGIAGETMQFHGAADRYALNGATSLATLYTDAGTATTNPAVTVRSVGGSGGQAAAFTYDLARSVVLTRQGNPAWIDQDRDGDPPVRPDDLFYGNASFDPQPDWIDLSKAMIPQADEQQHLLANLILYINEDHKLLPRFWFFPDGHKALVVMTGDNHGSDATLARFQQFLDYSPSNGVVEAWETVRASSYLYVNPESALLDANAAALAAQGFELALHVDTGCADYTREALHAFFLEQLYQFQAMYPSLPPTRTHRVHCLASSGYTMLPEVELSHGIRLSLAYYPPDWGDVETGFIGGSAMPMRFATTSGTPIDVYQGFTHMTDENGQTFPEAIDLLLDRAAGPEGYYGAFLANIHNDEVVAPAADEIVLSAQARNVPIISAEQLLEWIDARNASSVSEITWTNQTLSFTVLADEDARGLQSMVPVPVGYQVDSILSNGVSLGHSIEVVKGVQYVRFPAVSTTYEVAFVSDTQPPEVLTLTPADATTNVQVASEISAVFDEAIDPLSLTTNSFALLYDVSNIVAATVSYEPTSRRAVLTPAADLDALTTYTATLLGGGGGVSDVSGNTLASNVVWTFTTEPPDMTPPEISSVDPAPDETNVLLGAAAVVSFSENMDPSTITTNTFYLMSESSNTVNGTVTFDALAHAATFAPADNLALQASYTGTVVGGAEGVKDLAGNGLVGDFTWSFSTIEALATSVWEASAAPTVASAADTNAVELGMKFESLLDGYVTGIRFYKGPTNTGTHVGNLWTLGGSNLASVVFSGETATGWQDQPLVAPVAIAADTTYVVSYHAPNGGYAADVGYFAAGGVTNYPLRALADGEQGGNGVFGEGPAGTFPSSSFSAANYWVDVVFQEALGPDTNAPVVTAVIPTNGATEVDVNTSVQVTFNEAMATGTIDAGTIRLLDGTSNVVSAVVSYEEGSFTATLTPSAALSLGETYTGQVLSNVTDEAGNPMGTNYLWSFTTELPDTTAPEVLEVSPTNGAEEVSVETTVQVVFNEAMDPASITTNTVVLLDESSNVVAATVSYDGRLYRDPDAVKQSGTGDRLHGRCAWRRRRGKGRLHECAGHGLHVELHDRGGGEVHGSGRLRRPRRWLQPLTPMRWSWAPSLQASRMAISPGSASTRVRRTAGPTWGACGPWAGRTWPAWSSATRPRRAGSSSS